MGAALTYLSGEPVRELHVDEWPGTGRVSASGASMQGWRRSMEDAHCMCFDSKKNVHIFGVFDGHGGSGVARYCAQRFPALLQANENYQAGHFDVALHEAFLDIDLETQEPAVQEELFRLHLASKADHGPNELRLVEIHLPFETLLDLFLGDPLDQARHPGNPFRVFQDDYVIPKVEDHPPSKRGRSSELTWGAIAGRVRRHEDPAEVVEALRELVVKVHATDSNILIRLKDSIDWSSKRIVADPLAVLFEGSLVPAFHSTPGVEWSYSIHPVDLMAALNNNHMTSETEPSRRCVSDDQGCTANVCLLVEKENGSVSLYCANAGDARAIVVLPEEGSVLPLSIDHKPSLPGERRRVLYAGGRVVGRADPRVQGDLNLSRAIGDWRHKQNPHLALELQMISPRPDITVTEFVSKPNKSVFLVMGCDGIWERFSSADCGQFVHTHAGASLKSLCTKICETTIRGEREFPGSPVGVTIGCDNMSVLVVKLQGVESVVPSGAATMPVINYGAQVPDEWRPAGRRLSRPKRRRHTESPKTSERQHPGSPKASEKHPGSPKASEKHPSEAHSASPRIVSKRGRSESP